MTHGEVIQLRKDATPQYCLGATQRTQVIEPRSQGLNLCLRYFPAPSLSLFEESRGHGRTNPDTRYKDCLYGQTISRPNPNPETICYLYRQDLKRNRYRSPSGATPQWAGAWVSNANLLEKYSWNIVLTACRPLKLSKPTGFSSRIRPGSRVRPIRM